MKTAIVEISDSVIHALNRPAILTLFGIAILFAGSQISIPLQPVPITLQTVSVMLIGLTFSPMAAFYTVGSWLLLGFAGLPMFAGLSSGPLVLVGPTGGFLFGFVAASVAMAFVSQKIQNRSWLFVFANCLMGTGIISFCGLAWLTNLIGLSHAITYGFLPFIIPGLMKAAVLSAGVKGMNYIRG